MIGFSRIERSVSAVLLPVMLLFLLLAPCQAQEQDTGQARSSNVKWVTKGDIILITYDLEGTPETNYEVFIAMKREHDTTFSVIPRTIEGSIGEGVTAGTGREVRWYYRRDYPLGFSPKEYYFEIQIRKMEEHSNLIYYVAGAAAVAGGIIAVILGTNQPSGPPPPGDLPVPPVRP